jgi:two-component system, NarL family, nitrate/nitrite response regulator NarL
VSIARQPDAPPSARSSIRILIASRLRIYRDALAEAIRARGAEAVKAVAFDDVDVVAGAYRPDVILVDAHDRQSLRVIRQLATNHEPTAIVALGIEAAEHAIRTCASSGASAFLLEGHSLDDLVQAVDGVATGNLLAASGLIAVLLRELRKRDKNSRPLDVLTLRQLEILERIADGCQNKQIASDLNLSERTVKNHVHNILDKLSVRSRTAAAALLREERVA